MPVMGREKSIKRELETDQMQRDGTPVFYYVFNVNICGRLKEHGEG